MDVAVVGVGVRLPGGIRSLDGLWAALSEGRHLVGEVPDWSPPQARSPSWARSRCAGPDWDRR